MKRIALGAGIAALAGQAFGADLVLEPPPAPPVATMPAAEPASGFSGHVEAYVGGIHVEDTGWTAGGVGRGNYNFRQRWNVQGDVFADGIWNDDDVFSYGGAGHVYWRDPSAYAFGVFAAIEAFDGYDSKYLDGLYRYTAGPEAQVYFGNMTLYGQAFFGELRGEHLRKGLDTWGARGVLRYFATDNLRFDGELGYRAVQVPGSDINIFSVVSQANYRFAGTPLTAFGRYQFEHVEDPNGEGEQTYKFVLGLRASFGSSTLLEEDRYGATMDVGRHTSPVSAILRRR